jgi:nucleoside-diphosphate-sugar epimerase
VDSILISGTSGFVGSHLKEELNLHYHVLELNRSKPNSIRWHELQKLKTPLKAIIHCSGLAHDASKNAAYDQYYDANVKTTRALVELANRLGVQQFIYLSSVKVYGNQFQLDENTVTMTTGPYGRSKLEAEAVIKDELHTDCRGICLRPVMIYGKGNKGNLPRLISFLRKGFPYPFFMKDEKRTMLSLENLIAVIKQLLKTSIPSGSYIISDDDGMSTSEILLLYEETRQVKFRKWSMPTFLMGILSNWNIVQKITRSMKASNKKILKALGWKHMPHNVQDSLRTALKNL